MYVATGVGIAMAVTIVLAMFLGFGKQSSQSDRFGVGLLFRFIAEVMLIAGFVAAFVATAVLNSGPSWQLFGGYAATRICVLVLELLSSSKR